MDLKKFLEDNPLINKAELARLMFPHVANPAPRLSAKLSNAKQKTGTQRLTDDDKEAAKVALSKLVDNICKEITSPPKTP